MTTKQFIEKFGLPEKVMENCLQDDACPNCGSRDGILVTTNIWVHIYDDGTDTDSGDIDNYDHEYDEKSPAYCSKCNYHGKYGEFEIPGLDDAIEEELEKRE